MPYLQSTALEAVSYDEKEFVLRAKFRADGTVVTYENVPLHIYDSLIFADSVADFFKENIEGAYPARVSRTGGPSSDSSASRSRSRATSTNLLR